LPYPVLLIMLSARAGRLPPCQSWTIAAPMPDLSAAHAAVAMMRREMRVTYGPVADRLNGEYVAVGNQCIFADCFLLRTVALDFHYRKGEGVTIACAAGANSIAEELYLNGSVYSAVACINGLYPLHASAIAFEGKAYGFSGDAGAGKSTLATALGQRGFPLFCDDTMILELSDPENPVALPGHKRIKLTPQAIAMLGSLEAREQVDDEIYKFYVDAPSGDFTQPLPLGQLCFLDVGAECSLVPVRGSERLGRLHDDHGWQFAKANDRSPPEWFSFKTTLARAIPMSRFIRPIDPARFAQGVSFITNIIREGRFPQ